jgi:hypothetical protein
VGGQADLDTVAYTTVEIIRQHNMHILLIRHLAGSLRITMGARRTPPEQDGGPIRENFFNDTFFS